MPLLYGPAEQDRDPTVLALGQQRVGGTLVQQRVAPREQETVDVHPARELVQHLRLVHPGTDRGDETFLPHADHFWKREIDRLLEVIVGIV